MYRLGVSMFQCSLFMFCPMLFSGQDLELCWPQVRGDLRIGSAFLHVNMHVVLLHGIGFEVPNKKGN